MTQSYVFAPGRSLFEPTKVGLLKLANRIVMAPLTRNRAAPGAKRAPSGTCSDLEEKHTSHLPFVELACGRFGKGAQEMPIKVLIVEDDLMIADLTEEVLLGAGYAVCGIARTVADGVALYRLHKPSLAVVDMRLADGGLGTEIIALLEYPAGFGVLYATGNVSQVMAVSVPGCACLTKPFSAPDLLRSLELVYQIAATGSASPPFPRGFRQSYLATAGELDVVRR